MADPTPRTSQRTAALLSDFSLSLSRSRAHPHGPRAHKSCPAVGLATRDSSTAPKEEANVGFPFIKLLLRPAPLRIPLAGASLQEPSPSGLGRGRIRIRWPLAERRRTTRRASYRTSRGHSSTRTASCSRARTPRRRTTTRRSARRGPAARRPCAHASMASTPSPVSPEPESLHARYNLYFFFLSD